MTEDLTVGSRMSLGILKHQFNKVIKEWQKDGRLGKLKYFSSTKAIKALLEELTIQEEHNMLTNAVATSAVIRAEERAIFGSC